MSGKELPRTCKEPATCSHSNRTVSPEVNPRPRARHNLLNDYEAGTLPPSVTKQVLRRDGIPSASKISYAPGTRMIFHFETVDTETGTLYDDTRTLPKPMELIFGKNFQIQIWEMALHTMTKGEISSFQVPRDMCTSYPTAAKIIREANQPGSQSRSRSCCCGQLAHGKLSNGAFGSGHQDLDTLLQQPRDLTFTFEILDINLPGQFDMEACYLTDKEKADSINKLRLEGNKLCQLRKFTSAIAKYEEAGSRLENLLLKERPGSIQFQHLTLQKVPILLNIALAHMKSDNYYEALCRCKAALEIEPENVKGLFRRGQCHKNVGNYEDAKNDFEKALSLDPTLKKAVKENLGDLVVLKRQHENMMRQTLKNMF